ncbi:NAD(P)/FAD-dependent oxidoreductase [Actinomadura latina]|uniref:NAD(P)/FAD-dependent oxidoreductase n=1 Tax=Actinomadura latina TaxID=163603 RepID=A0A846YY81_9ACTN|nr:FAD/NAD(P)-binding oxidoreductase [Actinomadura latina]NKZ03722.1 NAD(P)/FAD-dependent oxidoreductase [Actinomadura latina]
MSDTSQRHRVLIIGGGTAGITVAARLRRKGVSGVTILEPSDTHWYQPLWTLVGGGQATTELSRRPERSVIPPGVGWIRDAAAAVDPDARTVTTASGTDLRYEYLVLAPGLQLDWTAVPGLAESVGHDGVSSNYAPEYAPKTWEFIRNLTSGTAVFTHPAGPIKCGGAPQKIAYLAADHWRREGRLDDIRIVLSLAEPTMFKVETYARELEKVAARYGIEVRLQSELISLDPDSRELTLADNATGDKERISYDFLHATPPQSAPDWVKKSSLAAPADPRGFVEVDPHTLVHPRYPNVYALGDVANLPTSKTGAAVRKQAPVVVENLVAGMAGRPGTGSYDGYTSCPLVTARDKMLLAEFDYDLALTPSFPFINLKKERRDMWYLKRYGLPALYWHAMLKGRL